MSEQASPDSIDVDLSAGDAPEKCVKCGVAMNRFNRDLNGGKCVSCTLGGKEAVKLLKAFTQFADMPETSVLELESYGVGASAGRILLGALILGGATFAGSIVSGNQGRIGSWVGWFLGAAIVTAVVFRKAHPIDLVRWRRFWRGHLVGFVIAVFAGIAMWMPSSGTGSMGYSELRATALVVELQVYALATVVGIVTGFLWVAMKNGNDRDEIVVMYREWERRKAM